jgi:hypothetical protein
VELRPAVVNRTGQGCMDGVAVFADFSILLMVLDIEENSFWAFSMSATNLIANFAIFAMRS